MEPLLSRSTSGRQGTAVSLGGRWPSEDDDDSASQLTFWIRKEKNKEHAKLCRARKKIYIEKLKETILFLESTNSKMLQQMETIDPDSRFVPSRSANSTDNYHGLFVEQMESIWVSSFLRWAHD